MRLNSESYQLIESGNLGARSLIIGIAGLVLSAAGILVNIERLFHAYLTAFLFWFSIVIGGLFFVMLHHLVSATWSVVIRRIGEAVMSVMPLLVIFFLPVLLGIHDLYHWSHKDAIAQDHLLQIKEPYLNTTFFIIRAGVYFLIWILLGKSLLKTSLEQDYQHNPSLIARMKKVSAPGMVLFALTLTFAAFDWIMSLDAHWYSTIFGVYIFSGSFLAILSFLILVLLYMRNRNVLHEVVTIEHYHDLGKYSFAFIVFWAYIAFSQFMLIWYGNIPEETLFFRHRWEPMGWRVVSLIVLFGHFVIPFLALVTRSAKRNLKVLMFTAIWILVMHWIDLYWLVLPNYGHGLTFSWMDITSLAGIGGVVVWYFWKKLGGHALIPVNDPKLKESIKFVNQ